MSLRTPAAARARTGLIILASVALLLGACSSSSGSSAGASTAAGESTAASAAAGGDATVATTVSDLGTILTDAEGMTIYFFANDEEGVSNCTDDCLANWPPVEVEGEPTGTDGVTADLGTMTRDDGTTQLTVNGYPAYLFANDSAPGDITGQGVGEIWWVFGADGEPIEG